MTPQDVFNNAWNGVKAQGHIQQAMYLDPDTGCRCAVGFSFVPPSDQNQLRIPHIYDGPHLDLFRALQNVNDNVQDLPSFFSRLRVVADHFNLEVPADA